MIRTHYSVTRLLSLGLLMFSLGCASAQKSKDGFRSIFDGKTLKGWDGDTDYWRVEDGKLVGEITPEKLLKTNSFIIWQGGQPGDFELKASFRITEAGNSGINYRSERLSDIPFALRGYQADIDGKINYTGQNYEERKRTTLAYRGEIATIRTQENPSAPESLKANVKSNAWQSRTVTGSLGTAAELKAKIRPNDWNEIHIIAKGTKLQHYVNGVLMSEVNDEDGVNRNAKGYIGVQVHVGPPMKVEYKDIRIRQ